LLAHNLYSISSDSSSKLLAGVDGGCFWEAYTRQKTTTQIIEKTIFSRLKKQSSAPINLLIVKLEA
jgi:hypothetical protein